MTSSPRPSSADERAPIERPRLPRSTPRIGRWRAHALRFAALLSLIVLLSFPAAGADRFRNAFEHGDQRPQLPEHVTSTPLRVLAFNTFLRPPPVSWGDATTCRARRIGERLTESQRGVDIAVLTESFKTDDVLLLSKQASGRFPFQRLSLPESHRAISVNGGLSILSRYPIDETRTEVYRSCAPNLGDCFASKGILYVRVALNSRLKVNVVATHLDAGGTADDQRARQAQLAQMRAFVDRHVDTERWPTLIVGDMNINGVRHEIWEGDEARAQVNEYGQMLSTLGNSCISCRDDRCRDSCKAEPFDAFRQARAPWRYDTASTRAVNTMNCNGIDLGRCDSPNDDAFWKTRRRLDYVFMASASAPEGVRAAVRQVEHPAFDDDACGTYYLSDHRAVSADIDLDAAR